MAYCSNCMNKALELFTIRPTCYSVQPVNMFEFSKSKRSTSWNSFPDDNKSCPVKAQLTSSLSLIDLPWLDIVFPHILSRLKLQDMFRLRRVSKRFEQMISDCFSLAKCIDLNDYSHKMTPAAFKVLTSNLRDLRTLNVNHCKWLTNDQLIPLIQTNRHLDQLDISNCFEVNNFAMEVVAKCSSKLTKLNLKDCHWLTNESLLLLVSSCNQLEQINISSCWEITDETMQQLAVTSINLRVLIFSRIYGITDATLLALAHNLVNLNYLDVTGCWRITDYGVRMVGEYCSQLKTLAVADCRDITESAISCLKRRGINVILSNESRLPVHCLLQTSRLWLQI